MSERIKLLPESVANQIAAGEVVNRPASVIKEMMENAIDACARSVTVNFRDGGKELIQIIDNGCGMSPIDARLAFDRHATSKIDKVDDIYTLSTFGFRGEALASIAAVAEVELLTRQCEDELGSKIEINGGKFIEQSVVNTPVGSQFMVRNLFYNVPARRRFLDKSTTEARHITTEFQRVALTHPEVAFSLFNNDAPVYKLDPSTLKQRIVGLIGKSIANNLLEVSTDTTIVKIQGFVGRPTASKRNNKEQFFFVNGRYFRSAYFHKAIVQAYEKLIPSNTQPAYFIYLTIDPERIDVNVHPQKTEVKFEDGSAVWQIVNAAVRESLAKLGVVPMMDFDMDTSVEIPLLQSDIEVCEPISVGNPDFNPFIDKAPSQTSYPMPNTTAGPSKLSDRRREYLDQINVFNYFDKSTLDYITGEEPRQSAIEVESGSVFTDAIPFGSRYAVTTVGGMLTIVDTVRAREAILFDKFMLMLGNGNSYSQQLLFPGVVTLSIDDYTLMREHAEDFATCGFDIAFCDEHTVEVRGIPADFTQSPLTELIYDMLDSLREETANPTQVKVGKLAAIMAKIGSRSATRFTSSGEVNNLLAQLENSSNPNYTPSGAPVMTSYSEDEIKKRFNQL